MNEEYRDKHAEDREKKQRNKRHGLIVTGRSIISVILPTIKKKAEDGKEKHSR